MKSKKCNTLIILIFIFSMQSSYGDFIPFELPSNFTSAEKSVAEYPPNGGESHASSIHNEYNYNHLLTENVIFAKEVYPQTEFRKNENITIRIFIINNKLDPLENTIILEP